MMFSFQTLRDLPIRIRNWQRALPSIFYNPSQLVAPHFPDVDWTLRDDDIARKEGWNLYDAEGLLQIECNCECDKGEPPFASDQDAIEHVDHLARRGSRLHQRALEIHQNHRRLRQRLGISPSLPPHCITDGMLRILNPDLDRKNFKTLRHRARQFSNRCEPMVGDFVEFSAPDKRPLLQIWSVISSAQTVQLFHPGTFVLRQRMAGIWSNGPAIERHLLTDTGRARPANFRFWDHHTYLGEFVNVQVPCKVWAASPDDLCFSCDHE